MALFFVMVMLASALIPSAQVYAESVQGDAASESTVEDKPQKRDYASALPVVEPKNKPAGDYQPPNTQALNNVFGSNRPSGPSAANVEGLQEPGSGISDAQEGEIIDKRTASSQTFRQKDGKLKVRQYASSRFYQKDGAWTEIDLTLVEDTDSGDAGTIVGDAYGAALSMVTSPDSYKVKANGWTARFAPSGSKQAMVRVKQGGQQFGFSPVGAKAGVTPVITTDDRGDQTVHYYDLWPGVNVEYLVGPDTLKENIVLKDKQATRDFQFEIQGASLKARAQKAREILPSYDIEADGDLKDAFSIAPFGVVLNRYGPEDTKGALRHSVTDNVLNVSLTEEYLQQLPDDAYPVAIDPSVTRRSIFGTRAGGTYASYKSDETVCDSTICNPYAGSVKDQYGVWRNWRGIIWAPFDFAKGKTIESAKWELRQRTGLPVSGTLSSRWISASHATCWWYTCKGAAIGSVYMAQSGAIDATSFYRGRQAANAYDYNTAAVMLTGEENVAVETYKNIDPGNGNPDVEGSYLEMVIADVVPAPTITSPVENQVFVDPQVSFKVNGGLKNPASGAALQYEFCVSTSPQCGGAVMASGVQTSPQWTIPDGILQDGVTYNVSARSFDPAVPVYSNYGTGKSFRIDARTGKDSTQAYDTLGPVSVDLATGNLTTGVTSHSSAALGGSMGVSLDYNSPFKSRRGLSAKYWNVPANHTGSLPAGTANFVRVDPVIDFNWAGGSPSAGILNNDWFYAQWTGFFTAPKAGNYTFGANNDDGMSIRINDQVVYDANCGNTVCYGPTSVALQAGQTVPIDIRYMEAAGLALAKVFVKGAVPDQVIPADWLQTGVRPVVQTNGLTGRYYKDPDGTKSFTGANVSMMMQRIDPVISFNWQDKSSVPNGPADKFLVRWEGYLTVPTSGTYEFATAADDGSRITIGTTTVLDRWQDNPGAQYWGNSGVALTAGSPVPIKVEYYENAGNAAITLKTRSTGASVPEQIIPSSWLSQGANILPDGWTMGIDPDGNLSYDFLQVKPTSVVLTDSSGSTHEYKWDASSKAYKPPVNEDGTLFKNEDGTYTLQDIDGRTYIFRADGTVESVTSPTDDLKPAALKYTYGGTPSRLTQITDGVTDSRWAKVYYYGDSQCPVPPVTPSVYDAATSENAKNKLCAVKTDDGRATNFYYLNGQLSRIVEPGEEITDFQYDGFGRVMSVRDVTANDAYTHGVRDNDASMLTEISYDDIGRVKAVKQPAAKTGDSRIEHTVAYKTSGLGQWQATQDITGQISAPVSVSWGGTRTDLFARDASGLLMHKYTSDGVTWSAWASLGGCITENPSVTSWAVGRLDVFARGCNATGNNLYHKAFANGQWYNWDQPAIADRLVGSPSAVSWGYERLDYVVRSTTNTLLHGYWTPSSGWQQDANSFGGCLSSSPSITSSGVGRLEIFSTDCATSGDNLTVKRFNGIVWSGFAAEPGIRLATVNAAHDEKDGVMVAGRDTTNALRYRLMRDDTWHARAACIADTPSITTHENGVHDVFYASCADGWKQDRYQAAGGTTQQHVTGAPEPHGFGRSVEYDRLLRTVRDTDVANLTDYTEWDVHKDMALSTTDETGLKSTTIYDDDDRAVSSYGPAPAAWFGGDRKPLAAYASQVPRSDTGYDEGITGTNVAYYAYSTAARSLKGAPKLHTTGLQGSPATEFNRNFGTASPVAGSADWGLRATAKFRVPTTGQWNIRVHADDGVRLFINDVLEVEDWYTGPTRERSARGLTLQAGKLNKFRLEYFHAVDASSADNANVKLCLTAPGTTTETCSNIMQYFTPDYDLATSSKVYDSTIGDVTATTNYGTNPELGLAQSGTIDPGGLDLTASTSYEAYGAAGSFLRQTSSTKPGDQTDNPSFRYEYYAATATADNPCTIGVTESYRQAGFMKKKIEASPGTTTSGGSGDAPVVRSSSSGSTGSGTLTLTKPTGTTTGDLLVMTASADLSASENVTYTVPAGWTQVLANTRSDASSAGNNLQVWYRIAGASEPASYDIVPDHQNLIGGSIMRIDGHDPVNPLHGQNFTASLTGEASAPSVTTTAANTRVLRIATWDQSKTLSAAPSGVTQSYFVDVSGHDNWGGSAVQATAGATGVAQWDLSGAAPYVGFTLAIKPAASGGTSTPIPGRTAETIYNDSGQVVASRMNQDDWTCLAHDARGRVTQSVVPTINGRPGRSISSDYLYQGSPLKTRVVDAVSGPVEQEVDLLGRSVSSKDQFGNVTSVAYDSLGRMTSRTSVIGTETFTYDTYSRMTGYLVGGVKYATVTYDAYSRVQDVTYDQALPAASGTAGDTPAVRSSSSATTSSGTLTLAKPSGTVNGDLLVMTASADLSAGENVTYSIPSGWTQLLANTRSDAASAGNNLQVWYKVADNEAASYAVTPDHDNLIGGSIMRIDGHDASDPIDVSAATASLTGEASAPSVTTTVANTQLLRIASWDQTKTLNAIPAGHTQSYHVDVSGHDNWGGYKEQAAVGATGVAQWDLSGAAPYVGFTAAVKPAASSGTSQLGTPMKLEQLKLDDLKRAAGAVFRFSDGTAFDETVVRSQRGSVTSYTDAFDGKSVTATYDYDKAGRLLEAVVDNIKHAYGYAAPSASTCSQAAANLTAHKNSNRTQYVRTNASTGQVLDNDTYCYDEVDRLLASSDLEVGTPTYDDHGNTVAFAGNGNPINLTYDALDYNMAIEQGGTKIEYLKTVGGGVLRKKEYSNGALTKSYRYVLGGAVLQSCSLTNENDCTTVDTYLSLPGNVTLTLSPTNADASKRMVYSIKNFHGDTAITANGAGAPNSSVYLYDPYGQLNASQTFGTNSDPSNATTGSMGWAADPTRKAEGLISLAIVQMGARVYAPTLGRFAQADPISGGNVNSYVYAVDPVNTHDYSGRFLQGGFGASYFQPAAGKSTVYIPRGKATLSVVHNPAPARVSTPKQPFKLRTTSPTFKLRTTSPTFTLRTTGPIVDFEKLSQETGIRSYATGPPTKLRDFNVLEAIESGISWYGVGGLAGGTIGCGVAAAFSAGTGCLLGASVGQGIGSALGAGTGFMLGGFGQPAADAFEGLPPIIPSPWVRL